MQGESVQSLLQATSKLGSALDDTVRNESERIWAEAKRTSPRNVQTAFDVAYGPHARHRLDVYFSPETQSAPVVVYVHGGGFTGGDKRKPEGYVFQNLGYWAVSQSMVGVNLTYRLAPETQWPAAADDVAAALRWVVENIAEFGGDPNALVIMGHSAGAAHVADFIALAQQRGSLPSHVLGAVLISGLYDIVSAGIRESVQAYYGKDVSLHQERSSLPHVAASTVPLLLVVAEYEPAMFHSQALHLATAVVNRRGTMPYFVMLEGHNHFSEMYHIGSDDLRLTKAITRFVSRVTSRQM